MAARALGAWMTGQGIEDDFTACDTPMLNRFFRDYQAAHGQSGTNTKQRNLRHLFTWLEEEYDHSPGVTRSAIETAALDLQIHAGRDRDR